MENRSQLDKRGSCVFALYTDGILFQPVPEAAGQMGITWAVAGGISRACINLGAEPGRPFRSLVADRKFEKLDRQRKYIGAIGSRSVSPAALLRWEPGRLGKTTPPALLPGSAGWPVVLFLGRTYWHQISVTQATYLRAFKREPS